MPPRFTLLSVRCHLLTSLERLVPGAPSVGPEGAEHVNGPPTGRGNGDTHIFPEELQDTHTAFPRLGLF